MGDSSRRGAGEEVSIFTVDSGGGGGMGGSTALECDECGVRNDLVLCCDECGVTNDLLLCCGITGGPVLGCDVCDDGGGGGGGGGMGGRPLVCEVFGIS